MMTRLSNYVMLTLAILLVSAACITMARSSGADGGNASFERSTRISMMANLHTTEIPSDRIEKEIEEKTGVQLDIQWVPDGSYDEKVFAALATGTLPQVLYLKNAASLSYFRDEIRSGLFWEIGPYLDGYPNLKRLKPEVLRNTAIDGKLYSLYQERALARSGIIYRKDWADRLGLPAPETLDDLYEMLKGFTYNDPDNNGIDDTIGLTDRNDLIYGAFKTISSYYGTPNHWGWYNDSLQPEFVFPQYMETMRFFKKLHSEGLVNEDFPITSKTDQQELFITGKAGVYIGAMGDVLSLQSRLLANDPEAVLDVQNRVRGPEGFGIWASQGYGTVILFPKSAIATEEELKNVLSFYDALMSPELANLMYWGIEGTHYTVQDGKAVAVDAFELREKDVKPYQALMAGSFSTIPGMLEPVNTNKVKDKAERLIYDNESFLIYDPTAPLESPLYNEIGVRLNERMRDATYQFMLGMIDEKGFQAEIDRWLEEGGSQIIEEYETSYRSTLGPYLHEEYR